MTDITVLIVSHYQRLCISYRALLKCRFWS